MTIEPMTLAVILGMAAVTYLTRIAGFWLVRRVPLGGRTMAALEAVPVAVLTSVVAPVALATGWPETAAALVTLALARRVPVVVAVLGGVVTVAVLRRLIG